MVGAEWKDGGGEGITPSVASREKARMRAAAGPQDIGVEHAPEAEHDFRPLPSRDRSHSTAKGEKSQAASDGRDFDPANVEMVNRGAQIERIDDQLMASA